jgi:hypothetical protein
LSLVSEIIQQAYRETNLIPLGATPNINQLSEALTRLNSIILSAIGNEIAEPGFREITIGGDEDQSDQVSEYVPHNTRLMLNVDGEVLVGLQPKPYEGMRVALVDIAGNLSAYPFTIDGNGRNIEGDDLLVVSENNASMQWMYRADIGNWVRITSLTLEDQMPFPEDFDDYFVGMLALRLSPRYGQMLPQETVDILKRSRQQLRARYKIRDHTPLPDAGLLSRKEYAQLFDGEDYFDTGRYPWLS